MEQDVVKNEEYLTLADLDYETSTGWICPKGYFYPCEYTGHWQLMDDLREKGYMPGATESAVEDSLVKLSGGRVLCYGKHMSPRARLTVETILQKYHDEFFSCVTEEHDAAGFTFYTENKKVKSRRS